MGGKRITKPNKWFSCDTQECLFVNVYETPDPYVLIRNHRVIFVGKWWWRRSLRTFERKWVCYFHSNEQTVS